MQSRDGVLEDHEQSTSFWVQVSLRLQAEPAQELEVFVEQASMGVEVSRLAPKTKL